MSDNPADRGGQGRIKANDRPSGKRVGAGADLGHGPVAARQVEGPQDVVAVGAWASQVEGVAAIDGVERAQIGPVGVVVAAQNLHLCGKVDLGRIVRKTIV